MAYKLKIPPFMVICLLVYLQQTSRGGEDRAEAGKVQTRPVLSRGPSVHIRVHLYTYAYIYTLRSKTMLSLPEMCVCVQFHLNNEGLLANGSFSKMAQNPFETTNYLL